MCLDVVIQQFGHNVNSDSQSDAPGLVSLLKYLNPYMTHNCSLTRDVKLLTK